jgi:hypothetical protein
LSSWPKKLFRLDASMSEEAFEKNAAACKIPPKPKITAAQAKSVRVIAGLINPPEGVESF